MVGLLGTRAKLLHVVAPARAAAGERLRGTVYLRLAEALPRGALSLRFIGIEGASVTTYDIDR